MSQIHRRSVALLVFAVFLLTPFARTAPALCCLIEKALEEVSCCSPADETSREASSSEPCNDGEYCPLRCCILADSDPGFPLPARVLTPTASAVCIAFVSPVALGIGGQGLQPTAAASPPLFLSRTPLHLQLQVLLS